MPIAATGYRWPLPANMPSHRIFLIVPLDLSIFSLFLFYVDRLNEVPDLPRLQETGVMKEKSQSQFQRLNKFLSLSLREPQSLSLFAT